MKFFRRPSPRAKRRLKNIRNIRYNRYHFKWHREFAIFPVRVDDDKTATAEYRTLEVVYVSYAFPTEGGFHSWVLSKEQYETLSESQKNYDDVASYLIAVRERYYWECRERLDANPEGIEEPIVPDRMALGV